MISANAISGGRLAVGRGRGFSRWILLVCLVLAGAIGFLLLPGFTLPILAPDAVASLETVTLGDWPQGILIRGRDRSNPILLFVHGGPGMPAMYLNHAFGGYLEENFVVVHWDQRGAGRSFSRDIPAETMTTSRILDDAHELMLLLLDRFDQEKLFLVGHSWGSYLGMILAQRHPDLIHAYVGVGQVTDPVAEAEVADAFLRRRAREAGLTEVERELDEKGTDVHEKWLFEFGAELADAQSFTPLLVTGLLSLEYDSIDAWNVARGSSFSSAAMRWDALEGPLTEEILAVDVPVWLLLGRGDYVTPSELGAEYLDRLVAPRKKLVWFEESAHFPFFEEPRRFGEAMLLVREDTLGRGASPGG